MRPRCGAGCGRAHARCRGRPSRDFRQASRAIQTPTPCVRNPAAYNRGMTASATATGFEAPINRCPPGGMAGVRALARLTGQPVVALDPGCGEETPSRVALIDEDACIGCTKCIQACPVDAIVGAGRLMHTVIAGLCTGCELCLPPCPVDCIAMVPDPSAPPRLPRPVLPCPP